MINSLGLCTALISDQDGTVTTASHLDYQNKSVVSGTDVMGRFVWISLVKSGQHVFSECSNEGTETVDGTVTCSDHLAAVLTVSLLDGKCLVMSA